MYFDNQFQNKKVLITGHTGFKGAWLSEWLLELGAEVHGYALDPRPADMLYDQLYLHARLESDTRADILDRKALDKAVARVQPDFVFHLAAQPLVRLSYDMPLETFSVNVMGTVNLLECLRTTEQRGDLIAPCVVTVITTDKCYENREWLHAYREEDAMGGFDPYSASKGCVELAVSAYRRSYFGGDSLVSIASARAGNVIGGGDWAKDRIIPDCFRALQRGEPIQVRNRTSTRPWQHVLEPLSGYLWLAASLFTAKSGIQDRNTVLQSSFNFGPQLQSNRTVADVVNALLKYVPGSWLDCPDPDATHEAGKLNLAIEKAYHILGWKPVWDFERTIEQSTHWYQSVLAGADARTLTLEQIELYCRDAAQANLPWAHQFQ